MSEYDDQDEVEKRIQDHIHQERQKIEAAEWGGPLLADVERFLGRFVVYPSEHARVAHVLWIVHTHLMDKWDSTPRLAFLSAEPASGKTRALEVSELLVPSPVQAVNVSPVYLFRKLGGQDGCTILFDEIDTVFGPKAKENEEIRGLLNAGHRRGAVACRCVTRGKEIFTEEIPAYCAVALAGLHWLPDTIMTRSVIVRMQRRKPGQQSEPFRRRKEVDAGHKLRNRLAQWARHVEPIITSPLSQKQIGDRNDEPFRKAIWDRRCRPAGCHEARRNNRGPRLAANVGIATGRAGMDHVCRGTQLVLDQGGGIRVRRNGR
jgi:hypothetical protein